MRIAIPTAGGNLAMHFGHCEAFTLIDADPDEQAIFSVATIPAPEHQPGLLPGWLAERGADVVIAGGMGGRAQALFANHGIEVVVGAPASPPKLIAVEFLAGTLQAGENVCDH